jgi:hypothetical protein
MKVAGEMSKRQERCAEDAREICNSYRRDMLKLHVANVVVVVVAAVVIAVVSTNL